MTTGRFDHVATLLNNGKVLVTGGQGDSAILGSAEIYDPTTATFAITGSMQSARHNHSATLLNNGNVLLTGGYSGSSYQSSAELYNAATGSFTATGGMYSIRYSHTATRLNNGNILIASGAYIAGAEIFQPDSLTPAGLVAITVTPANPSTPLRTVQQLTATGTFSDGSTQILQSVTWTSSNTAVAPITNDASNHGMALAAGTGITTITATAGSVSASTLLTVQ